MPNQPREGTLKAQVYEWLDENHDEISDLGCHKASRWIQDNTDLGGTEETLRTYVQEYRQERDLDRRLKHTKGHSGEEGGENSEEESALDAPATSSLFLDDYLDRKNAYYNEKDDVYVVWIDQRAQPIDGDDYRAMKRAYSNWDQNEDTIPEICRRFGISRTDFRKLKTNLGWTHDSAPYSEEELAAGETPDGENLLDDLLRRREQKLYRQWQKANWKETEKEAQKWREFKRGIAEPLIDGLDKVPKRPPKEVPNLENQDVAGMVFETDRHLNKRTNRGGFQRNRDRWFKCTSDLIAKMNRGSGGDLDVLYAALGSDLFHTDHYDEKTTAGTGQRTDLSQRKAIRKTATAATTILERYRDLADRIVVHVLPGNHDRRSCIFFHWGLEERYKDCQDVQIRGRVKPYQYEQFGNSLLAWHHGDGIGGGQTQKQSRLTEKMVTDVPELVGDTRYRYWFLGHKHYIWADEGASLVEQAPTMTEQGEYEDRQGFSTGHNVSTGWLFDRQKGQFGRFMGHPDLT